MERTCGFIRTLTRLYRRLHGRQTRIFQFSSTMRGGKLAIAALPPLSSAVRWVFQVSSGVRGGKPATEGFTAALIGGKLDFPVFLREREENRHRSFTAAPIGGKVRFPVFLRSERRKTRNCIYAAGARGGNLSIRIFVLFSLLLLVGGSGVGA
ncbi:hypothetical protein AAC387_Pa03g0616 [Persea americana]